MCVGRVRVLCVHYNLSTPSTTRTICSVIDSLWLGGSRCVNHKGRRLDSWPWSAAFTGVGGRGMEEDWTGRLYFFLYPCLKESSLQSKSPAGQEMVSSCTKQYWTREQCTFSLVYLYRMYFILVILPRLNSTLEETGLRIRGPLPSHFLPSFLSSLLPSIFIYPWAGPGFYTVMQHWKLWQVGHTGCSRRAALLRAAVRQLQLIYIAFVLKEPSNTHARLAGPVF